MPLPAHRPQSWDRWVGAAVLAWIALQPVSAWANVIWPAAIVYNRIYSVPTIVIGLLVEIYALRRWFMLGWRRAVLVAVAANLLSGVVGLFAIPWGGFLALIPFGWLRASLGISEEAVDWPVTFLFILLLTTAIEMIALRLAGLPGGRRTWRIWLLANLVSVAIAFLSFVPKPSDYDDIGRWRPWLIVERPEPIITPAFTPA